MIGNWTFVDKGNIRYDSLFEWIAQRSDLKDRTLDNAIKYLYNGDLIYFKYSDTFFIVQFDSKHYEGLCTLIHWDRDHKTHLKAFSDKGILQNPEELKQFVLEGCNLFLANSVHES